MYPQSTLNSTMPLDPKTGRNYCKYSSAPVIKCINLLNRIMADKLRINCTGKMKHILLTNEMKPNLIVTYLLDCCFARSFR